MLHWWTSPASVAGVFGVSVGLVYQRYNHVSHVVESACNICFPWCKLKTLGPLTQSQMGPKWSEYSLLGRDEPSDSRYLNPTDFHTLTLVFSDSVPTLRRKVIERHGERSKDLKVF